VTAPKQAATLCEEERRFAKRTQRPPAKCPTPDAFASHRSTKRVKSD